MDIEGEGTVGLITYMRTDSLRLSEEALASAKGPSSWAATANITPRPTAIRPKANAQDGHEAIRPSNVNLTPEQVKKDLTGEQYRSTAWFGAGLWLSQMANAVYDSVAVEVEAGGHASGPASSSLKFSATPPCTRRARTRRKRRRNPPLPALREGETSDPAGLRPEQHFTQPPAHYTDATLIRAMEEQGIGRPSTYAPTVSTILDRGACVKEGKYLRITNLGRVVTALMKGAVFRHRGHEVHRQYGAAAGLRGGGKTAWKESAGVLRGL